MKFTIATVAALAVAVAAKPAFLNTEFDVEQGAPFTLKYSGCESGCTITLLNGDSKDLNDYKVLTAEASGASFTFTPSGLPTDTYAFKITDNETGEYNYSGQFEYEGTGAPTTAVSSTAAASTTAVTIKDVTSTTAESSTKESSTKESTTEATSTTVKATTLTKVTTTTAETPVSTPAQNSTTPVKSGHSSTKTSHGTSTAASSADATSSVTTVPDSGAARLSSSIALIAGAVMAMVYLN
jgi:hypothetical protein